MKMGEPFEIRTADGENYPVPHQDFIALSPKGFTVTVYGEEGYSATVSVRQVTSVVKKNEEMAV